MKLGMIDAQVTSLLLHAKKIHRKLRKKEINFSLEASKIAETYYL